VSGAAPTDPVTALAIDTTSHCLSLALMKEGRTAARHYSAAGTEMNRTLLQVIDGLMREAGMAPEQLELIIAARGPGSFTGTRIGLALARSFAQLRRLPLIGVDTLGLLAAQAEPEDGLRFHAVLNCTRDEVYHAPFLMGPDGPEALGEIAVSTFASLPEKIGAEPVVLRRFPPEQPGHDDAVAALRRLPLRHAHPDAALLLEQGMRIFRAGAPFPPAEPIYLRPEAFRKWKP
jgi:tRNA threonylcarbamoyladenosine biosynthesis protein TsaB